MKTYYTGEVFDYINGLYGDEWDLLLDIEGSGIEQLARVKNGSMFFLYQFINPNTGKWESFREIDAGEWKHINRRYVAIH